MRKKSDKSKLKQGYGTGKYGDYKPYVRISEFNSQGTCCNPIDWKTGRTVHLLSQGEKYLWYMLRFSDYVDDIREQFPLNLNESLALANKLGIQHPHTDKGYCVMTTDFLVDLKNGKQIALSVKNSNSILEENDRTIEKLYLENQYWTEKGIEWRLIYTKDLNVILARNIEEVSYFYRYEFVNDDISLIKYLIANKILSLDMTTKLLDYRELADELIPNTTIKELEANINSIESKGE